jgi:hypothetical protein
VDEVAGGAAVGAVETRRDGELLGLLLSLLFVLGRKQDNEEGNEERAAAAAAAAAAAGAKREKGRFLVL